VKSEKNINNIFGWLDEITYNKREWFFFSQQEKDLFNPFMVHRFISMKEEYIDLADTIQKYAIDKRLIYQFYCSTLPKKKEFFRYIKSKSYVPNKELLIILSKYFEISTREIKDNWEFFKESDLKSLLLQIGIDEKQIKKLLK
jgi:hypothetical protein